MIKHPVAILALLTGLNFVNYLDRFVLSAVLPRLMPALGLSKLEGGLLATVFLLGYFATAPIFGALGDRLPRKGLIAVGILIWSVATIASGLATTLPHLILARVLVGVGEASYATLSPTIIDDITPPEKKGRALSYFYLAVPLGSACGFIIGGGVEAAFGWRAAFFIAGVPGILLALICLLIEEPARKPREEKPNIFRDLGKLFKTDLYRKGVLGYCAYTAAIGAFSYWAPVFLFTRYGLALAHANFVFGLIIVVAGGIGTIVGGRMADGRVKRIDEAHARATTAEAPEKLFREQGHRPPEAPNESELARDRVRAQLWVCALGSAVGAPLAAFCFLSPSANLFFVVAFAAMLFLFLSTSPVNAVILQAVPNSLRASAMALAIFAIHMFGDLWSPPLVGFLADNLPIQLAMMTLPVAIAVSAVVWWPRVARKATA